MVITTHQLACYGFGVLYNVLVAGKHKRLKVDVVVPSAVELSRKAMMNRRRYPH